MEDEVVEACRVNLDVWKMYWEGILDAAHPERAAA